MKENIFIPMILVLGIGVGFLFFLPHHKPAREIPRPQIEIQTEENNEPEQPDTFDKKYQVLRTYDETVSFGGTPRYTRKIKVNLGLSAEELSDNLIHAALEIQKEKNAKDVQIFAYRPDDMERDLYTAGVCTLSNMHPIVELAEVYFMDVPSLLKAESNVVINTQNTKLYRTRDIDPDDVFTYLKKGQRAIIVGSMRSFSTDEFSDFYMIRLNTKGKKNITGWVFGDTLDEVQDVPVTQPSTKKRTQKKRK